MNKDEALKIVIENLELQEFNTVNATLISYCKEALEQPAQEPVAWMNDIAFSMDKELLGTRSRIVPLYTHPAPSWQGLTKDEILEIPVGSRLSTARSIEQALKEKNHG